jgi:hypothetical protein
MEVTMAVRVVKKVLAGIQDLLLGEGKVTQERNGIPVEIEKINAFNIPFQGNPGDSDYITIGDRIQGVAGANLYVTELTGSASAGNPFLGDIQLVAQPGIYFFMVNINYVADGNGELEIKLSSTPKVYTPALFNITATAELQLVSYTTAIYNSSSDENYVKIWLENKNVNGTVTLSNSHLIIVRM